MFKQTYKQKNLKGVLDVKVITRKTYLFGVLVAKAHWMRLPNNQVVKLAKLVDSNTGQQLINKAIHEQGNG